jgi:uncharacterized membrane protein YfcA
MDLTLPVILWCVAALFVGGLVKGVAGLGLPLTSVPLLTLAVSLKSGIGILVVPLIVSNFAQSFQGGMFRPTLRRFWALLLALFLCGAVSTKVLASVRQETLYLIIGPPLIVVPLLAHFRKDIVLARRTESWASPVVGVISGFLGGISSFYGPILMLYLVWLRLSKKEFVAAVALMFFVGSVALAVGLLGFGITRPHELLLSAAGCIPVFIGLWFGQKVHVALDERRFALVVLGLYLATGISFIVKGL